MKNIFEMHLKPYYQTHLQKKKELKLNKKSKSKNQNEN
jgi:hypothetical protein